MPTRWWPVPQLEASVPAGRVVLRPPERRDGPAWAAVRTSDVAALLRWEAVAPGSSPRTWAAQQTAAEWRAQRRAAAGDARAGRGVLWTVALDGVLAGQVVLTAGPPAAASVQVGYWLGTAFHGRRVGTAAVALAVLHATSETGMGRHRVVAEVHPDNLPSRRLLAALGFREEGLARRSLYVDGAWRDHLVLAVTAEEVPRDLLARVSSP